MCKEVMFIVLQVQEIYIFIIYLYSIDRILCVEKIYIIRIDV